jgi:hypothetical protein
MGVPLVPYDSVATPNVPKAKPHQAQLPLRIIFPDHEVVTLKIPQSAYSMMNSKIPDHVILPRSRLYTLISKASDTTFRQILGQMTNTLSV